MACRPAIAKGTTDACPVAPGEAQLAVNVLRMIDLLADDTNTRYAEFIYLYM